MGHGPAVLPGALATKVSGAAATDPYSITGGEQEEGRGTGGPAGRQQQAAEGNRCAEVSPHHIGGTPNPGTGMRHRIEQDLPGLCRHNRYRATQEGKTNSSNQRL